MEEFSRATGHGPEHEAHFQVQSAAHLRLMKERTACSPRAAVAFSALSIVSWLREKFAVLPWGSGWAASTRRCWAGRTRRHGWFRSGKNSHVSVLGKNNNDN
jgi:hypothetical protein